MGSFGLFLLEVLLCNAGLTGGVFGAVQKTVKREMSGFMGPMPPGLAGPGIGGGVVPYGGQVPMGTYGQPPLQQPYGGYEHGPPYAGPLGQYGEPPPPYPPFGYTDPGFGVQTGFEGYLLPNAWFKYLPWGVEGTVTICVGIIVAVVIIVSIILLLFWLTGFGSLRLVKEEARQYLPSWSYFTMDYLNQVTASVMDALDRYNELVKQD